MFKLIENLEDEERKILVRQNDDDGTLVTVLFMKCYSIPQLGFSSSKKP